MNAIIFMGLQASGKSSFFREQFFHTHVRINLDMLRTRNRERILIEACLTAKQPFVIDNTNPTVEARKAYIDLAKAAQFSVDGYYFQSSLEDCRRRNEARDAKVPLPGLLGTYAKLVLPDLGEGFDRLFYVKMKADTGFVVEEWKNEV